MVHGKIWDGIKWVGEQVGIGDDPYTGYTEGQYYPGFDQGIASGGGAPPGGGQPPQMAGFGGGITGFDGFGGMGGMGGLENAFGYAKGGNRWDDPRNPFGGRRNQGMTGLEQAFLGTQIAGTAFGIYGDIKEGNRLAEEAEYRREQDERDREQAAAGGRLFGGMLAGYAGR